MFLGFNEASYRGFVSRVYARRDVYFMLPEPQTAPASMESPLSHSPQTGGTCLLILKPTSKWFLVSTATIMNCYDAKPWSHSELLVSTVKQSTPSTVCALLCQESGLKPDARPLKQAPRSRCSIASRETGRLEWLPIDSAGILSCGAHCVEISAQ